MNYEGILGLSEYAKNNALLIEQYIGNGRKTAKNREAVDLEKKVIKTIDKFREKVEKILENSDISFKDRILVTLEDEFVQMKIGTRSDIDGLNVEISKFVRLLDNKGFGIITQIMQKDNLDDNGKREEIQKMNEQKVNILENDSFKTSSEDDTKKRRKKFEERVHETLYTASKKVSQIVENLQLTGAELDAADALRKEFRVLEDDEVSKVGEEYGNSFSEYKVNMLELLKKLNEMTYNNSLKVVGLSEKTTGEKPNDIQEHEDK